MLHLATIEQEKIAGIRNASQIIKENAESLLNRLKYVRGENRLRDIVRWTREINELLP